MKGDIYVMESKMNEFIKITEGEKVALIDPVGKVCLGVSKRFADNLDKPVSGKVIPCMGAAN